MQFVSFQFVICFLILFWSYWFFCRSKDSQNVFLLVASYAFYACFDWRCCGLLLLISLASYFAGAYMDRPLKSSTFLHKDSRWWVCVGAISFCLAILVYFKYTNFFLLTVNELTRDSRKLMKTL